MKSSGVSPSWKTLPAARNTNGSFNARRPSTANVKDSTRNRSLLTEVCEGTGTREGACSENGPHFEQRFARCNAGAHFGRSATGIEKAQIEPQEFAGIPGQLRFDIELRPGDQFKPGMIQVLRLVCVCQRPRTCPCSAVEV